MTTVSLSFLILPNARTPQMSLSMEVHCSVPPQIILSNQYPKISITKSFVSACGYWAFLYGNHQAFDFSGSHGITRYQKLQVKDKLNLTKQLSTPNAQQPNGCYGGRGEFGQQVEAHRLDLLA